MFKKRINKIDMIYRINMFKKRINKIDILPCPFIIK